jgi:hypothetical protein
MKDELVRILQEKANKARKSTDASDSDELKDFSNTMVRSYEECITIVDSTSTFAEAGQRLREKTHDLPQSFERNAYKNILVIYNDLPAGLYKK